VTGNPPHSLSAMAGRIPIRIRIRWPSENCFVLNPIPLIVIAGIDPVIPTDSSGCGDHRVKPGDDGEAKFFLPPFIAMPMETSPAVTVRTPRTVLLRRSEARCGKCTGGRRHQKVAPPFPPGITSKAKQFPASADRRSRRHYTPAPRGWRRYADQGPASAPKTQAADYLSD
jgi:hypothetical protein